MRITTYLIYLSMKTDCAHLFRSHYLQTKQRPSQNKAKHRVTMATNIDNGKPQRVKLHLRIRALHRCRRCWPACQACLQSAGCFLLIYSERNIITYALSIEWSNMYLKRQRERERAICMQPALTPWIHVDILQPIPLLVILALRTNEIPPVMEGGVLRGRWGEKGEVTVMNT